MEKNRIYYEELPCYEQGEEKIKNKHYAEPFYGLDALPTEGMQKEWRAFILHRGETATLQTMVLENALYRKICCWINKQKKKGVRSFTEQEPEKWIRQLKGWMMEQGIPLTFERTSVYGTVSHKTTKLIRYLMNFLDFIQPEDGRDEVEKDIWQLDELDIKVRSNPIYNVQTINFTKISQQDIREEVKKAIYFQLKYDALATVQRAMTSMRQFSKFLNEKWPKVQSCLEIDREIIESYLTYKMTESTHYRSNSDDVLKLRTVLENIGKLCAVPALETLFMNTDIPKEWEPEFKVRSDQEMTVLNAHMVKMDEQIARCMIIHQMLGTRISDTLTLKTNCLYQQGKQHMIRIEQIKTRVYEKPISIELASLILKAIHYTRAKHGNTKYIFVNEADISRPLQYTTIQHKVMAMIQKENLRDDKGNLFRFGSHLFRHYYGVKLTELHLDDWTIAKLLGHSGLTNVKHYRKMSNQLMADETREVRNMMTKIIFENLDGWGEEYEQIRQDDYCE